MITELRIENFAIIEKLTLQLQKGLVILTGETGAGKSIVLDAVELVLGGRADSSTIRSGAGRAYVEATFHLEPHILPDIHTILEREALLDDPNYLTLAREIRANGRSVARVNGRTVTVGLLRELGAYLVDIHGQSEHLSLLNPRKHLTLLDRYAQTASLLAAYRKNYHTLQKIRHELQTLRHTHAETTRRSELLTYQAEEIENAHLKPGEDVTLKQERDRMANAETVTRLAQAAIALLDESNTDAPAAADLIGQAVHALQQLQRYDTTQQSTLNELQATLETIAEITRSLRDYLDTVEYNPLRLEEIEERLDLLHRLKRKYGQTIEEILAYGKRVRAELDTLFGAEERIASLEKEESYLLQRLAQQAQKISARRRQAAQSLGKGIEKELADLHMRQARFRVSFARRPDANGLPLDDGERVAFDATGYDQVEFLIAPNPGEGFKPLAKIASGGETSRLMLALKNVLAQADQVPTLIFDEIDQGIGGRIGVTVGQKLWQLSRHHQVLCVTHLPQLAAFGTQHFRVEKQMQAQRTRTIITALKGEARLHELAHMLGSISETTLQSAQELLETARRAMN